MKIVLIQPKAYAHNPTHVNEPLNLGYLASYLRENGYKNIKILIGAFLSDKQLIDISSKADIVGFTATSPMMTHGKKIAEAVKLKNPSVNIVFGGSHPSVAVENTLQNSFIDVVVRGEGEVTFYELVRAFETNSSLKEIDGISYKENNIIINNQNRTLIENIDLLPFPARDIFDQKQFTKRAYIGSEKNIAWVLSSRGCPNRCTYCASHEIWTRKWRARSAQNIVAEIQELITKYNVNRIDFADDTFTVNKKRVIEFCELLKAEKMDISWGCNSIVNNVDKELFGAMRSAGCEEIWMGVESGSPQILKEIKKGISIDKVKEAFDLSKEAGLKRHGYFMLGAPSESKETINQTEQLIREINADSISLTVLTPYPGCDLYISAKENGLVRDDMDWSRIDLHYMNIAAIPTPNISKQELIEEHNRLIKEFQIQKIDNNALNVKKVLYILQFTPVKEYPSLALKFIKNYVVR